MRKEGLVTISLFAIILLSIGLASAGLFDYKPLKDQPGITGNAVITGQAVSAACAQAYYNCGNCEECIEAGNYWDSDYGCSNSYYSGMVRSLAGCYEQSTGGTGGSGSSECSHWTDCTAGLDSNGFRDGGEYCSDGNIWDEREWWECNNGECEMTSTRNQVKVNCDHGCTNGECDSIGGSACTSSDSDAGNCDTCESCTGAGHHWRDSVDWCYPDAIEGQTVDSPGDCSTESSSGGSSGSTGTSGESSGSSCSINRVSIYNAEVRSDGELNFDFRVSYSDGDYCDWEYSWLRGDQLGFFVYYDWERSSNLIEGHSQWYYPNKGGSPFDRSVSIDIGDRSPHEICFFRVEVYFERESGSRTSADTGMAIHTFTANCQEEEEPTTSYNDLENCEDCINEPGTDYKWCSNPNDIPNGVCRPSSYSCGYYDSVTFSSNCPNQGDSVCGNGNQETGEQCDGNDLNGQTCASRGFDGGTLSCTGSCRFDTSSCTNTPPTSNTCSSNPSYCNNCADCVAAGYRWDDDYGGCSTNYGSSSCGGSSECSHWTDCTDGLDENNFRPGGEWCGTYGDVMDEREYWECNSGECEMTSTRNQVKEECDHGCSNGECNEAPSSTCTSDNSDAVNCNTCFSCTGVGHYWEPDYGTCTYYRVTGSSNSPSSCGGSTTECSHWTDCTAGLDSNGFRDGGEYCSDGNIWDEREWWECNNGECEMTSTRNQVKEECDHGCSNGECNEAPSGCSGSNSDAYLCNTCESCTSNGHYWDFDYSGCSSSRYGLVDYASTPSSCVRSNECSVWTDCTEAEGLDENNFRPGGEWCGSQGDVMDEREYWECNNGECEMTSTRNQVKEGCNNLGCVNGECVNDPDDTCVPCTDLGYYSGGDACEDSNTGFFDVIGCSGCSDDGVCDVEDGDICLSDFGRCGPSFCTSHEDCISHNTGNTCLTEFGTCVQSGVVYDCVDNQDCIYLGIGNACVNRYCIWETSDCGDGFCTNSETTCPQDCITGYSSSGGQDSGGITPPDPPIIPDIVGTDDDVDDNNQDLPDLPSLPSIPSFSVNLPNMFSITGMASAVPQGGSVCGDGICDVSETTCSGDCPGPENFQCNSESTSRCSNGNVYWYDSCGNREGIRHNCGSNQYCSNGQCRNNQQSCNSHASYSCSNGNVYWYDSCGNREGIRHNCGSNQYCSNGQCRTNTPSTWCGDGSCNGGETCSSCSTDCGSCGGPPQPPIIPSFPNGGQECTGTLINQQDCSDQIAFGSGQTSVVCNTNTGQWEVGPCTRSGCDAGYVPGTNNNCVRQGTVIQPPSPPIPPTIPISNPEPCTGTPPGTQDCSDQIAHGSGHTSTICNVETGQWEVGPCVVSGCDAGYIIGSNNNCVVSGNPFPYNECYLLESSYCIFAKSDILCSHINAFGSLQDCEDAKGICGNGVLDEGEICDGILKDPNAENLNCEYFGFGFGELGCNNACRLDASACNLNCEDDENGIDLVKRGKVIFNGNEYYDSCNEEGFLVEQFCIKSINQGGLEVFGKEEQLFSCPKGTECFEGACVDKGDIPWRPDCSDELDCENSDETCVNGECVKVVDVAQGNYCEDNVCFFDVSFSNGVNFDYGEAEYFITYTSSSEGKVSLKVAELVDRSGISGFAKIENKELSTGTINHVMGLGIEVLGADLSSAKIRILQFSCLNDEICLGNFECSGLGVCAAPGAFCIIESDCNSREKCNGGVCVDSTGQTNVNPETNLCKLKVGEIAYCGYGGKTYQVARKVGCKFTLSSDEVTEEEFVLNALETKEFSNRIKVKRDVNGCASQYLTLRFEGGSETELPGCGNGRCSRGSGETEITCPEDCPECVVDTDCNKFGAGGFCVEGTCNHGDPAEDDFCDFGCPEGNNCYPMGYRKQGKYCGPNKVFLNQKNSQEGLNAACDNSFECSSNLCIDGECVSGGFMRSILEVFRDLFGGEENSVDLENNECGKDSDCTYVWFTGGCNTPEYVTKIMNACSDGSGPCPSESQPRSGVTCTCENNRCITHG